MKNVEGLDIAIGKTVKLFRVEAGLSQEQLAEKCEASAVYISEIERGIKHGSRKKINKKKKKCKELLLK